MSQSVKTFYHRLRLRCQGQAKIDKLTHEVAYYKRHYFGVKAERLPVEQGQLFEETLAADIAAMTEELAQL